MNQLKYISLLFFFAFSLKAKVDYGVEFTGKGYSSEYQFSRDLKAEYDIVERSWKFLDNGDIKLYADVIDARSDLKKNFTSELKDSDSFFNKKNIWKFNWGVPAVFFSYGALFWDWGKISRFSFRDEGWFGGSTYAGGTDKLAHFYSHYLINRMGYAFYRNSGLSHDKALWHSTLMAGGVGFLIEVGDGLSHYGFSYQDLISDFLGIGLGHLLNSNAFLNELIGFQLWWWPKNDGSHKGQKLRDPVDDYNNQKYILNFRMAAIPKIRDFKLLRYINLDIGYYSRGFKDSRPGEQVRREIFTGLSLNLSQLLRDLFPKSDYAYYGATFFNYYQPPNTGFEVKGWEDRD